MGRARRWGRRVGAGLAAAALVVTPIGPASPAHAAAACTGVTVVVDFGAFGGGVDVRCFGGDPASGLEALQRVGFTVTGTQQYGLGFVCGIDGKPTAVTCPRTPPANASWSYWHASPGSGWIYSDCGVAVCDPAPGTVEGWAFAGAVPRYAPPAAPPANPPDPPPPAGGGGGGGGGGGTGGGTGGGGAGGEATPDAGASPTTDPDPSSSSASPTTTTSAPTSPGSSTVVGATPVPDTGGGALGALVGLGLVLILAGAAVGITWRRRRALAAPPVDQS